MPEDRLPPRASTRGPFAAPAYVTGAFLGLRRAGRAPSRCGDIIGPFPCDPAGSVPRMPHPWTRGRDPREPHSSDSAAAHPGLRSRPQRLVAPETRGPRASPEGGGGGASPCST